MDSAISGYIRSVFYFFLSSDIHGAAVIYLRLYYSWILALRDRSSGLLPYELACTIFRITLSKRLAFFLAKRSIINIPTNKLLPKRLVRGISLPIANQSKHPVVKIQYVERGEKKDKS
jgi:hypothetical protein